MLNDLFVVNTAFWWMLCCTARQAVQVAAPAGT